MNTPAPITFPPELEDTLLAEVLEGDGSAPALARKHGIRLSVLCDWLASGPIRDRIAAATDADDLSFHRMHQAEKKAAVKELAAQLKNPETSQVERRRAAAALLLRPASRPKGFQLPTRKLDRLLDLEEEDLEDDEDTEEDDDSEELDDEDDDDTDSDDDDEEDEDSRRAQDRRARKLAIELPEPPEPEEAAAAIALAEEALTLLKGAHLPENKGNLDTLYDRFHPEHMPTRRTWRRQARKGDFSPLFLHDSHTLGVPFSEWDDQDTCAVVPVHAQVRGRSLLYHIVAIRSGDCGDCLLYINGPLNIRDPRHTCPEIYPDHTSRQPDTS